MPERTSIYMEDTSTISHQASTQKTRLYFPSVGTNKYDHARDGAKQYGTSRYSEFGCVRRYADVL